jgi:antitoxin (DNA-binding transcriptional repressor) of toxin-antitoxin stability system
MRHVDVGDVGRLLTTLLEEVKAGEEVVRTEGGRPVARLVPVGPRRGVPDLAEFRRTMPILDPPLSTMIGEDREDRVEPIVLRCAARAGRPAIPHRARE